ncbi:hypothetical protein Hanom_Chr07g00613911 [Helianthus anomalus]
MYVQIIKSLTRGVQQNPDPKSNQKYPYPKYPKFLISEIRIYENRIIRIFGFGYEFQKFRII